MSTDPEQTVVCKGPAACGICKPISVKGGEEELGIGPRELHDQLV